MSAGGAAEIADLVPRSSVFRIEVCTVEKNWGAPWLPSEQLRASGTGFALEFQLGGKTRRGVLTNAHVVNNATIIQLVKVGSTTKQKAKILEGSFAVDLDLALLTVEDEAFWAGVEPMLLDPAVPKLFSDIMVTGFPTGGTQVCVTKGVVSRITTKRFSVDGFPVPELLAVQIDAAINSGNSGGPALSPLAPSICLGVAALKSSRSGTDNIGYIIPAITVENYLRDMAEHGKFRGIMHPIFNWTKLENKTLRERHSMPRGEGLDDCGVLVTSVHSYGHACQHMELGDVIVEIDGYKVCHDGTVRLPLQTAKHEPTPRKGKQGKGRRGKANGGSSLGMGLGLGMGMGSGLGAAGEHQHQVSLQYMFSRKRCGETVAIKVLRKIEPQPEQEQEQAKQAKGKRKSKSKSKSKSKGARGREEQTKGGGALQPFSVGMEVSYTAPWHWEWETKVPKDIEGVRVKIIAVHPPPAHWAPTPSASASGSTSAAQNGVAACNGGGRQKRRKVEGEKGNGKGKSKGTGTGTGTGTSKAGDEDAGEDDGYRYDVLNEVTKEVTLGVDRGRLRWEAPWSAEPIRRTELELELTLKPLPVLVSVRQHQPGASLSFFMVGGLVFINEVWYVIPKSKRGKRGAPPPPITWQPRSRESDQMVVLAEIFEHDCNLGYSIEMQGYNLLSVNGVRIRNLAQLKEVCEGVEEGFIEFEMDTKSTIVLDAAKCREAKTQLLRICNMQACCSLDLMAGQEEGEEGQDGGK